MDQLSKEEFIKLFKTDGCTVAVHVDAEVITIIFNVAGLGVCDIKRIFDKTQEARKYFDNLTDEHVSGIVDSELIK